MIQDEEKQSIVIQLKNRTNPEIITDRLQINSDMKPEFLSDYLNGILSTETKYIFYLQNERITENLSNFVSKFDLNHEEVIVLDYIDVEDLKADGIIQCEDIVTGMVVYNDKIYINHYKGGISTYDGTLDQIQNKNKYNSIVAGEGLYGYSGKILYDVSTGTELYTFESEIAFLETYGLYIAIGTRDTHIFVYQTEVKAIVETIIVENSLRGVKITNDHVYWIESVDTVVQYDLKTKDVLYFSVQQSITDILIKEDTVVCVTSDRMIVKIQSRRPYKRTLSLQMVDKISIFNNLLFLASQKELVVLDYSTEKELKYLQFDKQINAILVFKEVLYIAQGKEILTYNIKDLL